MWVARALAVALGARCIDRLNSRTGQVGRQMLRRGRKYGVWSVVFLALISCSALSAEVQVVLQSSKQHYAIGEPIRLSYQATWLGEKDGRIRLSSTGFPKLEISFLNQYSLEIIETGASALAERPSRHEMAELAPTMDRMSELFTINDSSQPIDYLDGTRGYYRFDRTGGYVIKAVFPAGTEWRLFDTQTETVQSTAVVIRVGGAREIEYDGLIKSIQAAFQSSNPDIQYVQILDTKPRHTKYWVVARGIIEPADSRGSFQDELFGIFVVDELYSRVDGIIDVLPTPRWHDYVVWISDYDMRSVTVKGHGATYRDQPLEKRYVDE